MPRSYSAVLAAICYTLLTFTACDPPYSESDLEQCEAIVDVFQGMDLPSDKLWYFYAKDLDIHPSIPAVKRDTATYQFYVPTTGEQLHRGKGRGLIAAYYQKNGPTMIFICTRDNGHAGEYGYAWSSVANEIYWDHDQWGEKWQFDGQVDDHWWRIKYDLD